MTLAETFRLFLKGGPGVCQVAVTNACNAHCRFCSFPHVPPQDRIMADPERLFRGFVSLNQGGIHYIIVTGGEPLLYPHLLPALSRARDFGLNTILITNGALLSPHLLEELQKAGLGRLIISLDAASQARHDEHRGLPGLTTHIQEMLPFVKQVGLNPIASVTLSRLIDDLPAVLRFLKKLGFERLTFSYPLTELASSYLGCAEHNSVDYTDQELDDMFSQILALKSNSPLAILNSRQALVDLKNRFSNRPRRFPCLAGFKYFYIDWRLMVYRCHFLSQTLGPLEEIHRLPPIRDGCDACNIECYRDASVFQYAAVSVKDTLGAWRRGEWLKGLGTLLNPLNFLSLTDLLEGRHWLRH